MQEIVISYTLLDDHIKRLKRITEEYKKQHGYDFTENKMFETIMLTGCHHDIDERFKLHEWRLGLREDYI